MVSAERPRTGTAVGPHTVQSHLSSVEDARLRATGLTSAEVTQRVSAGLGNRVPLATSRSFGRILAANTLTLFNAVAGGLFTLLLVLGYWQDALFGFFLVANALIGVVQEFRSKRTLDQLALLNSPRARVLRDGSVVDVAREDVVVDDLLELREGDQLSADAVVLVTEELEIDESQLTGEADAVTASVGREVLSGSSVVGGNGAARVIRVGAESYANRLTAEVRKFSLVNSELRREIGRIVRWISWALLPLGAVIVNGQMQAAGGWTHALDSGAWRPAVLASVGSIISMVPQGLVFMTSVAFAVGAVKLAKEKVLVQELAAVEGLARVDILCLDKTGTLTEGFLELDAVESMGTVDTKTLAAVLGWFGHDKNANATTKALKARYPATRGVKLDATIAFSSSRKWSAACFGAFAGTWVLGAPEVLMSTPSAKRSAALARAASLADTGLRTLVLAHSARTLSAASIASQTVPTSLSPVAIVTLREKVRPDAEKTLSYLAEQGIQMRVLSGDAPGTVAAVARAVGMPLVGDGYDARRLPTDLAALSVVLEKHTVFGRVTPAQKKDIVQALQRSGHVVAMTGDGVNDALALKQADIGIAMGSGAATTRAVSRIILLDGQFSHLPTVMAEGRQVIANVERLAKLFLTKTVYSIVFALAFGALLWPFPFLPRQLSVVDGLSIGLPAIYLALIPNTRRYLTGFLRRAIAYCVPSGVVVGSVVIAITAFTRLHGNYSTPAIHAAALIGLTLSGLWVLVVLARPFTLGRAILLLAMCVGLIGVFAVPLLRDFLVLAVPPIDLFGVSVGSAALACLILETMYRIRRRMSRR